MGSFKFSTFIVGMIIVSMVATVLALTMAEFSTNYGKSYEENESANITSRLSDLSGLARQYKNETYDVDDTSSEQDILGQIFNTGYAAIKTVGGSFDVMKQMINAGFSRLNLGEASPIIMSALTAIILIILFVGIIISVVVKRDV